MIIMIKKYRKELGLTQAEFAKKVGISRQTFNAIENGKYYPSLDIAFSITEALNKKYVEEIFIKEKTDDFIKG